MSEIKQERIFSTRDLPLAATLVSLKFFMLGVDYQLEGQKNNPVGYFKFNDSPELQEAKMKFSQGMLAIEPKLFVTNMHSLKAEVVNAVNQMN